MRASNRISLLVGGAVALVLVATAAVWWVFADVGSKHLTAFFNQTVGVYPGSDLRILGVRVGIVNTITPVGAQVKVTMTLNRDVNAPANAGAVVVSPSVVADRYVQLTPAYTGGPVMTDGTTIPLSRTATPLEIDQLYTSLSKLADTLGPNGANANGALSDLLKTSAANLDGNGRALGTMMSQLGKATRTLANSKDDFFGTITNLKQFTAMLRTNDAYVRKVQQQLATVSGFLAADRQDLTAALNQLATALAQVKTFIQTHRAAVKSDVDALAQISQILVNQRASLAEALDTGGLAVTNLVQAYDPVSGTLAGRANLNEISMGPPPTLTPVRKPTLPVPLPPVGQAYSSGGAK
ncbi:MCE family protein [Fodinicola acaciae]|uniref:MCE family protein n=1 Tax=Fodinicola acaciae TaxID=2681555 RepID=UPI0013D43F7B|nr:MCE family protein [Fodinicola acaciae]